MLAQETSQAIGNQDCGCPVLQLIRCCVIQALLSPLRQAAELETDQFEQNPPRLFLTAFQAPFPETL